jgi:hypothetical protein
LLGGELPLASWAGVATFSNISHSEKDIRYCLTAFLVVAFGLDMLMLAGLSGRVGVEGEPRAGAGKVEDKNAENPLTRLSRVL